jgi:uncharacterized Tic20 family protein
MSGMTTPPAYTPPPAPTPMSPADEKLWATLIHLSGIVLPLWGALIGYFVLRERGPFVRQHVTEAFNFQLSLVIYSVAVGVLSVVTLGIASFLFIPLGIVALIFMILAAIAANRWQQYTYPLTIRLIK